LTKSITNRAASIRQRILNLALERKEDFGLLLTQYGLERVLYRIAVSNYRDLFVLKGALLFDRPTRDADFLARGQNDPERFERIFREICSIVTSETILRWHRTLIAEKWNYSQLRTKVGRPRINQETTDLVLRMARENSTWGYNRSQGALANLGGDISDTTIGSILKQHGIEPAPERKGSTTWKTFIQAHWDVLAAIDFTTIEVWTKSGLATFCLLFVMELSTRHVQFAGCTTNPEEDWMMRVGRNLTDSEEGFLRDKRFILMDRDKKCAASFQAMFRESGIEPVRLPPKSPNSDAHIERCMRSLKEDCLERLILFGEESSRNAVGEFVVRYHTERNHQGLQNLLIQPGIEANRSEGGIEYRSRLGGMLRHYYRKAA
jgi:putative transposase